MHKFINKRLLVGVFPYNPDRWHVNMLNDEEVRLYV